jgi:hypothetical protein
VQHQRGENQNQPDGQQKSSSNRFVTLVHTRFGQIGQFRGKRPGGRL